MALKTLDRQLRYFLSIASLGSVSKAADLLDQTQSGLSRQLATLEAALGAPLFTRTGRGVELTAAGARLQTRLSAAFDEIDQAVDEIRHQGEAGRGSLRIATVHTASYYFTGHVVARFAGRHPQVTLSLLGRSSPEVVELVAGGRADLGFVYDVAVDLGTLVSEPLFLEEMVLITRHDDPPARPGTPDTDRLQLVGFPPHYALRRMLHSAGLPASYVAEAETVDAMLRLVASGLGRCILPGRIPDTLLAEFGLVKHPLNNPALRRWLVVITRADRPLPAPARHFLDCALAVAREPDTGGGGRVETGRHS
jgi:DNA-binding transcriptional LysR family regulator